MRRGLDLGRHPQGLQDDAVALGQLEQARQLFLVGVGVERRSRAGSRESRPARPWHAEGAAEIEVALGADRAVADLDPSAVATAAGSRRRRRPAPRAACRPSRPAARPAAGGMQPGLDQRTAGLDPARQVLLADLALARRVTTAASGSSR